VPAQKITIWIQDRSTKTTILRSYFLYHPKLWNYYNRVP